MVTASRILGDQVGSTAPAFLAILAVHVIAGLAAVIAGAIAALARKGSPRHIRAGRWYYRAITTVFATATALAAMRWTQDWYLFILGVEPSVQRRGLGGALMRPVLERADIEQLVCYLETENERNVPFYLKHGFELVVNGEEAGHSGVRFWTFRRNPNKFRRTRAVQT